MSNIGSANEFYANDIVYRVDKHKRIVIGSIMDSYVATSDDDTLQKGQVRVLWYNNSHAQVWRQNKLCLMNRNIMPGDVVRRVVDGKETQLGYCKSYKNVTTVEIVGTNKIIEHVNGDRLRNVQKFHVDSYVILGTKFGRVENFEQMVTMTSSCGSVVEINTVVNDILDDYWSGKKKSVSHLESYYPGQEVVCTPSNLTQPNWIIKTKQMRRNLNRRQRFTIQNVEYSSIEVVWLNVWPNCSSSKELTKDEIKQLKILKHPNIYIDLGERKLLRLNHNDVLINKKEWLRKLSYTYRPEKIRHSAKSKSKVPLIRSTSLTYPNPDNQDVEDEWSTEEGEDDDDEMDDENDITPSASNTSVTFYRKRHYPPKPSQLTCGNTLPVEIICFKTKLTVVWQDGSEEDDIPSTQLHYSISLDDHEFFPSEWVIFTDKNLEGNYGVVQYANNFERTAMIKLFSYCEKDKKHKELYMKEFSVYDLQKHPKYIFRPAMLVKSKNCGDGNFVGRVIDSCPQGYVLVCWNNGSTEKCQPYDIELMPDEDDCGFSECSSDYDDDPSWETESIESFAGDGKDETSLQNLAARLDFLRNRIIYLKNMLTKYSEVETFSALKDIFLIYENSSYFDKFLGTSYFSLKNYHFQAVLAHVKDRAKTLGIELHGRIFSNDTTSPAKLKIKHAEKETLNKMLKLENKINSQIEKQEPKQPGTEFPTTPTSEMENNNICVELLSMIALRMDLVYADIISRIGGPQVCTVLTQSLKRMGSYTSLTPGPSCPTTPEGYFSDKSSIKDNVSCPTTPEALIPSNKILPLSINLPSSESFSVVEEVHETHHFFNHKFLPSNFCQFNKAITKEYKLLRDSLPAGVWVRAYLNRIDLLSVMIRGPANTPYQDGLFLFDIMLSADYPRSPPSVHYISYNSERLNPNLYVEGKVCVSLLGTWTGRGTEVWGPDSTLLQLFVSIQGLILVAEPYYNEAGYEKQTDTQQGQENSRIYNELVILKLVQSMGDLLTNPPKVFETEIIQHFQENGFKMCERLECYYKDDNPLKPEYPLLPVSKGLKISLAQAIDNFKDVLHKVLDEPKK